MTEDTEDIRIKRLQIITALNEVSFSVSSGTPDPDYAEKQAKVKELRAELKALYEEANAAKTA